MGQDMMDNKVIDLIQAEVAQIQSRNPRVSLRALAMRCEISSGTLSELLTGKRILTEKSLLWILARFPASVEVKHAILKRFFEDRLQESIGTLERSFQAVQEAGESKEIRE